MIQSLLDSLAGYPIFWLVAAVAAVVAVGSLVAGWQPKRSVRAELAAMFEAQAKDIDSEPFAHEDFWAAAGVRGE